MSVSKGWLKDEQNISNALALYRSSECPTLETVARELETTYQNIHAVMNQHMPKAEYKALAAIRYSHSKRAEKNPHFGKRGEEAVRWKGQIDDGYGYLTLLKDGKRQFVHRIVMAEALGLEELPMCFDVHHIDKDTKNNDLDNLALVTRKGHLKIHYYQEKDTASVALKKLTLREAMKYMT